MSKVIGDQVKRFKEIVNGVRKHLNQFQGKGVDEQQLMRLNENLNVIEKQNDEIDKLRVEIKEKVRIMNRNLVQSKADMKELKKVVKNNFANTYWPNFGILDKR